MRVFTSPHLLLPTSAAPLPITCGLAITIQTWNPKSFSKY